MKLTKKYIKESREIENLNYLLSIAPELLPSIKTITNKYYTLEKCETIKSKDFMPSNFHKLYIKLIIPLHRFNNKNFTPGIYKYFAPCSLNFEIKNQYYVPYIMSEFEKIINNLSLQIKDLLQDVIFSNLLKFLRHFGKQFKKWKPVNGYSLLHGDLHIGNIVKKENNFLLIDFEYLRYGASELEIANLVISSLIYHCRNDNNDQKVEKAYTEYNQIISKLPFLDGASYKFFFTFSLNLFYLSLYIRKKEELDIIRKITRQMFLEK